MAKLGSNLVLMRIIDSYLSEKTFGVRVEEALLSARSMEAGIL